MSSERKYCGCLVQATVSKDGEILERTDYCSFHGREMVERNDREWKERRAKK